MNNINNNTNTKSDYNIKINATIEILENIKIICEDLTHEKCKIPIENIFDYLIYDPNNNETILLYFLSSPLFSNKMKDFKEINRIKDISNLTWIIKNEYFEDIMVNSQKYK